MRIGLLPLATRWTISSEAIAYYELLFWKLVLNINRRMDALVVVLPIGVAKSITGYLGHTYNYIWKTVAQALLPKLAKNYCW